MKKLLFVCLGNICRSPAAEAIMKKMVSEQNLTDKIHCDSAGTAAYHSGNPADERMTAHGRDRGYELTSISRKVYPFNDFAEFDYIIAMDHSNRRDLVQLSQEQSELNSKLVMMCDYCEKHDIEEVPDPYYGGDQGFVHVFEILEDACSNLLKKIKKEL